MQRLSDIQSTVTFHHIRQPFNTAELNNKYNLINLVLRQTFLWLFHGTFESGETCKHYSLGGEEARGSRSELLDGYLRFSVLETLWLEGSRN